MGFISLAWFCMFVKVGRNFKAKSTFWFGMIVQASDWLTLGTIIITVLVPFSVWLASMHANVKVIRQEVYTVITQLAEIKNDSIREQNKLWEHISTHSLTSHKISQRLSAAEVEIINIKDGLRQTDSRRGKGRDSDG